MRHLRFFLVVCGSAWLTACVGSVGSSGDGQGPSAGGANNGQPGNGQPGNGQPGNGQPGNGQPGNGQPGNNGQMQPSGEVAEFGRTPLRRLTRAQFNNTVKDLLGLTDSTDFTAGFNQDDDGIGFRANTNSPVSETQADKYDVTAETLAGRAVTGGLDRIAPCATGRNEADCAADFIRGFGKRAFRRPLTDEQVTRYRTVFDAGRTSDGNFAGGVRLVLTAMLQSPYFLYLPEAGTGSAGPDGLVPLDNWEVASRLSYFIQDTMPDADLFAAAEAGRLKSGDEIATQARRLLATPRGRTVMAGFFRQWLEMEAMGTLDKDEKAYPEFNDEIRSAMVADVDAFLAEVSSGNGPDGEGKLRTVLTAGWAFPKGPLAPLYGVAAASGRADLPSGQRAGIFTLAGLMALYAHPDQSAPVSRGYLVSDKLLCVTPPPAPDNLNVEVPKPNPNQSTRERFSAHRDNDACRGCHQLMDPYGLTFENYDGLGRWRTKEGSKDVDPTSELPGIGKIANAVDLMGKLAGTPEVASCMTKQWFRLAHGRMEAKSDAATLSAAEAAFVKAELRIPDLIVAIASAPAFRGRTPIESVRP